MTSSDWVAICSAFVALCALFISVWQGVISRKHNRLAVAPQVNVHVYISDHDGCFVDIRNAGLGPAILDHIEIETQAKTIRISSKTDWHRVFREMWNEIPDCNAGYLSLGNGSVLAAGDSEKLLLLQASGDSTLLRDAFRDCVRRSRITVKYRSMYQEKFFEVFDGENNAT